MSETGIRAADFIRTVHTNIDDRIAAFTFDFTPLAYKVFKHKKKLRVAMRKVSRGMVEKKKIANLVILNLLLVK